MHILQNLKESDSVISSLIKQNISDTEIESLLYTLHTRALVLDKKYNDYSVSPKIRQTLLHWGYELTLKDYNNRINMVSS